MRDIKNDIEDFIKNSGITVYKLAKESSVHKTILYDLLSGKRKWMLNRTEQKLREAMARLESENV